MREKKPKKRECYVLRAVDGTLVEVTREVYLEWYQARRREKYQLEKMRKHGVSSLSAMEEQGGFQKSYLTIENELEKIALKNICVEKL